MKSGASLYVCQSSSWPREFQKRAGDCWLRSAEVFLVTLVGTLAVSAKLSGSTIGLTLPGSGVVIGPVTNICQAALNCPALASDLQPGYSTPAQASFSGSWIGTKASENLTATGYASVGILKDSSTGTVTSGNYPITELYGDAASFVEDTITQEPFTDQ